MDTLAEVELTASCRPVLTENETLWLLQDHVGLYDGKNKVENFQDGVAYLTSHRLVYVDRKYPRRYCGAFDLSCIKTGGFLRSSPKITFYLNKEAQTSLANDADWRDKTTTKGFNPWVCPICTFRNTTNPRVCDSCGVARSEDDISDSASIPPEAPQSKRSRQSSSSTSQSPLSEPSPSAAKQLWQCAICTHRNDMMNVKCERCGIMRTLGAKVISETPPDPLAMPSMAKVSLKQWICSICAKKNAESHHRCVQCGIDRAADVQYVLSEECDDASLPQAPTDTTESSQSTEPPSNGTACPTCTFINHPSMVECEICGTRLPTVESNDTNGTYTPTSLSRAMSDISLSSKLTDGSSGYIKVSFRDGGATHFYSTLKSALSTKAWEKSVETTTAITSPRTKQRVAGIGGIETRITFEQEENKTTMHDAFKDLDALMFKAAEMVRLAESISTRLAKEPSTTKEENSDSQALKTYLLNLGVSNPVTKDSAGAIYHNQLARELAEFLDTLLRQHGGMQTLTDIYCMYNRARGVALISPEDLYKACSLFPQLSLPFCLRRFDSGLLVLQSLDHSDERTAKRIQQFVKNSPGTSALQLASASNIAVGIAMEQLLLTEKVGLICRDEYQGGLLFYENIFGLASV